MSVLVVWSRDDSIRALVICSPACRSKLDGELGMGITYGPFDCGRRKVDAPTFVTASNACLICAKTLPKGRREKLVRAINQRQRVAPSPPPTATGASTSDDPNIVGEEPNGDPIYGTDFANGTDKAIHEEELDQ